MVSLKKNFFVHGKRRQDQNLGFSSPDINYMKVIMAVQSIEPLSKGKLEVAAEAIAWK